MLWRAIALHLSRVLVERPLEVAGVGWGRRDRDRHELPDAVGLCTTARTRIERRARSCYTA